MAPFSIPVPHIVPLQIALLGGPKSIQTSTKIELVCDTYLEHEIFYTIDGTKPQPYAGIVQGNKTIKYSSPFCLPPGRITVKAIAVSAKIHSMRSNIVTKCFEVVKDDSYESPKKSSAKKSKKKNNIHKEICTEFDKDEGLLPDEINNVCDATSSTNVNKDCFDDAFIASTDVEIESNNNKDSDIEDAIESSYNNSEISETQMSPEETEDTKTGDNIHVQDRTALEEFLHSDDDINIMVDDATSLIKTPNIKPVFCCQKCDTSLQQCFSCKRINSVSSKFCIECGIQLAQVCYHCKEHNPCFAVYCQCCGNKLDHSSNSQTGIFLKIDHSATAKPELKAVGVQEVPVMSDKCIQTVKENSLKKNSPKIDKNKLPRVSAGRGYWHQQLDYICNHLKSYVYNNLDFRKVISDPVLCDFQSAHVDKDEDSVTVTMVFSQLVLDKLNVSTSDDSIIKMNEKI